MKFVPSVVTQHLGRTTLLAQRSSPEVLLVAGMVGMVGATVLACRATLKVHDILEDAQEELKKTDTVLADAELQHYDYGPRDHTRDRVLIKYQTGIKIVRAYAPAIIVGGISIYALTSSHNIMTKRNVALTAAYGALDRGFREYRERVVDKYGEDVDRELRYGSQQIEIEDPKTKKKKKVTRVANFDKSIYARFFDETCTSWERSPEYNMFFLKAMQDYANDMLRARGHIFLSEVYDKLGFERTHESTVVGWYMSKDGSTDNFVDFGIFNGETRAARDFVNGREGAILLDFNVDGVIWDKF